MKKFFFLLCFAFTEFATAFAQEVSEHMTFKGIPIDGTLNNFVSKLAEKGFTHIITNNGCAAFNGDFAGYKNCYIGVTSSADKDLVTNVSVMFPTQDTWSALVGNYFSLKEMLTTKYGKPLCSIETFQSYPQPEDDNQKMYELKLNRCRYYTLFEKEKGNVGLMLVHVVDLGCCASITYFDAINKKIVESDAIDDL